MEGKSVIRTNEHELGEQEGQRCLERVSEKEMNSCDLSPIGMGLEAGPQVISVLCYTHP